MPVGVSAWTPLANITVSGTPSTITFSSITQTFRDLILVAQIVNSASGNNCLARFNGDSAGNYPVIALMSNGSTSQTFTSTYSSIDLAATTGGSTPVSSNLQIFDYTQTDRHKSTILRSADTVNQNALQIQRWANTAAITSITISMSSGTFSAGTNFALYGVTN